MLVYLFFFVLTFLGLHYNFCSLTSNKLPYIYTYSPSNPITVRLLLLSLYIVSVCIFYLLGRRLANLSFFCILEHWGLRCILHYCQRSARKCIKTYFVYFVMYAIFSVLIVSNLIHSLTQIRTMSPTFTPTLSPTMSPTLSPSLSPTLQPTLSP